MFFKLRKSARSRALTLVDFVVAVGVGSIVMIAVGSLTFVGGKSLASLYANGNLDQQNRRTLDQMTKDLMSAIQVTNFSTNQFICQDWDTNALQYVYDSTGQTLTRIKGTRTNVLLTDCIRLTFEYGLRDLSNGTFSVYPTTNYSEIKAVTASWCCARKRFGRTYADQPQYATINIRTKQ